MYIFYKIPSGAAFLSTNNDANFFNNPPSVLTDLDDNILPDPHRERCGSRKRPWALVFAADAEMPLESTATEHLNIVCFLNI